MCGLKKQIHKLMRERERPNPVREDGSRDWESNLNHTASPWGGVFGTLNPNLPDFSVFIIEGGMARVVDKGLDTPFFTVFQDDVCELSLLCTEDEHSQAS